jgi:hypothetical protein
VCAALNVQVVVVASQPHRESIVALDLLHDPVLTDRNGGDLPFGRSQELSAFPCGVPIGVHQSGRQQGATVGAQQVSVDELA